MRFPAFFCSLWPLDRTTTLVLMTASRLRSDIFVTISGAGTPFFDGFSTASAAFLILLVPGLTALETALMTSLFLAGSFAGSLVAGPIADRFGRRGLFAGAAAGILALTLLAYVLPEVSVILAMRFLTGFLVGGDYPVSQAIVTESVSPERRTRALAVMMLAWNVGALAAVVTALPVLLSDRSWLFFWTVQAAVAGILLLMRLRVAESSEWLRERGRGKAGERASEASLDREALTAEHAGAEPSDKRAYRRNLVFCAGFWLCQTVPVTVMMFYAGRIIEMLTGTSGPVTHMLLLYGFFLVGAIPTLFPVVASRPRIVLLTTYGAMFAGLSLVAFGGNDTAASAGFVLFAFAYGLQAPLDFVYPNLLFPTAIRARAVGLVTALARVGATASAFAFPLLLEDFGAPTLFAGGLGLLASGFLLGVLLAPRDRAFGAGTDLKD